jgi:hypothetical protein
MLLIAELADVLSGSGSKCISRSHNMPPKQASAAIKQMCLCGCTAGLDVAGLKIWMTEVKRKYSSNETAQVRRRVSFSQQVYAQQQVGSWS